MVYDIVKALRRLDGKFDISPDLHGDAADEIERLRRIIYTPADKHEPLCDCAQCIPFEEPRLLDQ